MNEISADTIRRLVREALDAFLSEKGMASGGGTLPGGGRVVAGSAVGAARALPGFSVTGGAGGDSAKPPALLVLLTGGRGDAAMARLALQTLAQQFVLDLVITADFTERYGAWLEAGFAPALSDSSRMRLHDGLCRPGSLLLLRRCRGLVVPLLSRSAAAKASLGIDDDVPSFILCRALESGLPVVAVRSDADPQALRAAPALLNGPGSLRNLMEGYLHRLTGWGVRWSALETLPAATLEAMRDVGAAGGGAAAAVRAAASPVGSVGSDKTGALGRAGGMLGTSGPGGAGSGTGAGGGVLRGSAMIGAGRSGLSPAAAKTESAPSGRRRFITKEDIWAMLERGQGELVVCARDVVTPEAEEFAISRGVRIVREEASR